MRGNPIIPGFMVALLSLPLFPGCGGGPESPHVVLITLDTTRPDFLTPYGSERSATPVIAGLAEKGVVVEEAYAPVPVTRPTHASIFTGRYPRAHGVWGNQSVLSKEAPTLATILQDHGYRTAAAVSANLLAPGSGFERGFDRTNEEAWRPAPEKGRVPHTIGADETVGGAIEFLREETGGGKPLFLWLHLYDPHMPYHPPARFRQEGKGEEYGGLDRFDRRALRERTPETGGDVTAPLLDRALRLYAGEIEFVDEQLGRLMDTLRALGMEENTLLVLVADHGEGFDHGIYFRHAPTIYRSGLAIPLIVVWPGRLEPARVGGPVSAVDVTPTILDLLGIPGPDSMQGESFVPLLREGRSDGRPVFFSVARGAVVETPAETTLREQGLQSRREEYRTVLGVPRRDLDPEVLREGVIHDGWKLILAEGEPEALYHVAADPEEIRNRLAYEPVRAEALRTLYDDFLARTPDAGGLDPVDLSEEEKERLRSLGYMN